MEPCATTIGHLARRCDQWLWSAHRRHRYTSCSHVLNNSTSDVGRRAWNETTWYSFASQTTSAMNDLLWMERRMGHDVPAHKHVGGPARCEITEDLVQPRSTHTHTPTRLSTCAEVMCEPGPDTSFPIRPQRVSVFLCTHLFNAYVSLGSHMYGT